MHFLKKGQKIRAWVDPPPSFGQCPKENVFFSLRPSLSATEISKSSFDNDMIHVMPRIWNNAFYNGENDE